MRALRFAFPLLLLAALPLLAKEAVDPSIGGCTRQAEFAKRQQALDTKVAALTAEKNEGKRKKLAASLAGSEADIECLMRYREAALLPVFVEMAARSKKWFVRTRAIQALKMLGDPAALTALEGMLADKEAMVREAAANAAGHLGGDAARAMLEKRHAAESDPYVKATLAAALATASQRIYGKRTDGKTWQETLAGPDGARRVDYAWVQKGAPLFNDYLADAVDLPAAERWVYPVQRYQEDLFAGYPRDSFGAGGNHGGEDCAWFREGCSYYAIGDGVVRMVQGAGGDWGFLVLVEHRLADGRFVCSVYGHAALDITVKAGDRVTAGQRLATQGLSCSVENGGYGSHLHFGLGDGPFRRPSKIAAGDEIEFERDGKKVKGPVLRLVYAQTAKTARGWPRPAGICRAPDGAEQEVVFPEEELQAELTWFQAYVKDCRGWLNPQVLLPEWVEKKPGKGK